MQIFRRSPSRTLRQTSRLPVLGAMLALLSVVPPVFGQTSRTWQPYAGITLVERSETSPRPLHMHLAQIDLRVPGVRVRLSPPSGAREVVRESTLDALTRAGAQLAVNGHFFLPFPSEDTEAWVIGLAASDGRVYSAFEHPEQNFAIVDDAPALNIGRKHRATIVHRRPGGDGRAVREHVRVDNAVAGSAQIVTGGRVTIPEYRDDEHPRGTLTPGPDGRYANGHSWYDVTTARTVAGVSRSGRVLTLLTVDARGGSEGMRLGEIAQLLVREYGVWDALNLDGGGSTTMAWRDPVTGMPALLNTSSDNPAGRRVASSVLVFAPPAHR